MLSILIPTKDYDCCNLVESLHRQCEAIGLPYEIIVGEDGSSLQGLALNEKVEKIPNCKRFIKKENVGRSEIRNLLADEAKSKNIMFLDSDAVAEQDDIIRKYIEALEESPVVCGGLYHADKLHDKRFSLRYKYEKDADKHRSATERAEHPYDKFATFAFAIHKEIFMQIRFSKKIDRYGHEDTLFGHELQRKGIVIKHIDAPFLHNGLETNEIYLGKVEDSIRTLIKMEEEIKETPLLHCYNKLKRVHLVSLTAFAWNILKPLLRHNLLGNSPSITLLGIYKIGFFCNLKNQ